MSEAKTVPFEYTAGPAGVLRVTASDGAPYEIRLAVAVFEVLDTGTKNPDGTALFEVRANVTLDTKRTAA
jgi:hypothetical protein